MESENITAILKRTDSQSFHLFIIKGNYTNELEIMEQYTLRVGPWGEPKQFASSGLNTLTYQALDMTSNLSARQASNV